MTFPEKLKKGDLVRVVAPASSLGIISEENREIANRRFGEMGLRLSFGEHAEEMDEFHSSSIESRVADLHAAFADPEVKAIFPVIGGFNSNQLLRYLDWDLIRSNPKILCGYSFVLFCKKTLITDGSSDFLQIEQSTVRGFLVVQTSSSGLFIFNFKVPRNK